MKGTYTTFDLHQIFNHEDRFEKLEIRYLQLLMDRISLGQRLEKLDLELLRLLVRKYKIAWWSPSDNQLWEVFKSRAIKEKPLMEIWLESCEFRALTSREFQIQVKAENSFYKNSLDRHFWFFSDIISEIVGRPVLVKFFE